MRFRLYLSYLLMILILLTVLRETGNLSLSYYHSSISSSCSSTWSGTQMHTDWEQNDAMEKDEDSCAQKHFSETPVFISGAGMNYGDETGTCPYLVVTVSGLSTGLLWMPLFKSGSFSASASCSAAVRYKNPGVSSPDRAFYHCTGSLTITGTYSITGVCSCREAKQLILQHIQKEFYQRAKDQVRTWKEN